MNKKAVYVIFALVLSSLLLSSVTSGLITANVAISISGTIQPIELKNAIIMSGATSLSNIDTTFVASHFRLVICSFDMDPFVLQSLKTLNSNILILGYCNIIVSSPSTSYWSTNWTKISANENWFLHDVNGNRITKTATESEWYLMNISSGWEQFYVSYVNSKLNNTLFNGVFADDAWNQLSDWIRWGLLADASTNATLITSDFSNNTISSWHSSMTNMLQYLENNLISGMKVIINTNEYLSNDYLNVVDGKMTENFVYSTSWELNKYSSVSSWFNPMDYINAMARDSATGKIFFAENGAIIPYNPNSTIIAEVTRNVNYCCAATLLAMNGSNCYFSYNTWWSLDGSEGYYPVMSTRLGSPSDFYYQSQGVYMRDFANGIVLFNPSNNSYNVTLGQNYHLINGTRVSNMVLDPWSGEIILS
jgi:hypothetical protein